MGIVQKMARAAVIPMRATVIQVSESQMFDGRIASTRPIAERRHASVTCRMAPPRRSTHPAHAIIATDATV